MPSKYVKTPGGIFVPGERYTYESSEIFLSIVQAEYQHEIDRAAALDSKLGISLPVMATYFFLIIQETDIGSLWGSLWKSVLNAGSVLELFVLVLYLSTIGTAIVSLFLMTVALQQNYISVDIAQLYMPKELSKPKERFAATMAQYYLRVIELNKVQSRKRFNKYRLGWAYGISSLIYFSILYIYHSIK
ncbi:MAG: hypothetical protein IJQ81_00630 [Oscillibacter sp.]|nr:hypothetical protein [Oscillibacter sp.]